MVDQRKVFNLISSRDHCLVFTMADLRYAASRIWICVEPELGLCWIKLYLSDNHYTTAPCSCFMEVLQSFRNSCKIVLFTFSYLNIVRFMLQSRTERCRICIPLRHVIVKLLSTLISKKTCWLLMAGKFICTWNDLVIDIYQRLKIIKWLNRVNGGH